MKDYISKGVRCQNSRTKENSLTVEDVENALSYFNNKCCYCQVAPYECLDHITPVARGGKTNKYNIVPACKKCNNKKQARDALTFFIRNKTLNIDNLVRIHDYVWSLK